MITLKIDTEYFSVNHFNFNLCFSCKLQRKTNNDKDRYSRLTAIVRSNPIAKFPINF